jgi:cell fate regulator YaaT (PSP1 superfamily)
MLVRYGRLNECGHFEHNEDDVLKTTARVVVKTERGLELGWLVGQLSCYKDGQLKISDERINRYCAVSNIDPFPKPAGSFVRYATAEDIREEEHLKRIAREQMRFCRQLAKEMSLPMKIVDTENIFGGERIIFYFLADGRVDFRALVKKLAHEYQCRIEMRQIGSRDEAKLLGDFETCGQECCCKRFLRALKPVNMRMAKMQKATLDPGKISGYCGRLKCCLRYEDQTYVELKKRLPPKNAIVKFKNGTGRVIDTQILTQLVVIEQKEGGRVALPVDDIEVVSTKPHPRSPAESQEDNEPAENEQDRQ